MVKVIFYPEYQYHKDKKKIGRSPKGTNLPLKLTPQQEPLIAMHGFNTAKARLPGVKIVGLGGRVVATSEGQGEMAGTFLTAPIVKIPNPLLHRRWI